MRILGMISGTSHDGIDVAVVDFREHAATVTAKIEFVASYPYSDSLDQQISRMLPPGPADLEATCRVDTAIGQEFAAAAQQALSASRASTPGGAGVDAICTHGQTMYHWVEDGRAQGTLQLGQPAWIAEATGLPVVSDVRAADIAAGGQGAPLVPLLDAALLSAFVRDGKTAGALNLGGISNITVAEPGRALAAWDIGPANALIDAVVAASEDADGSFDRDGLLAAAGTVSDPLLDVLLADPYYRQAPPKSSGKELFNLAYVQDAAAHAGVSCRLPDLVATVTELTARTVADTVNSLRLDRLIASGGGIRNPTLMRRIRELAAGTAVTDSDAVGVSADQKEAVAFALIGWATMNGLPGNVPACTGASGGRVLGRLTPAPTTRLPPSFPNPPRMVPAPTVEGLPWSTAVRFAHPGEAGDGD